MAQSIAWRGIEVFAETRVIAWDTDITSQARQMPFMLGLNFYPWGPHTVAEEQHIPVRKN